MGSMILFLISQNFHLCVYSSYAEKKINQHENIFWLILFLRYILKIMMLCFSHTIPQWGYSPLFSPRDQLPCIMSTSDRLSCHVTLCPIPDWSACYFCVISRCATNSCDIVQNLQIKCACCSGDGTLLIFNDSLESHICCFIAFFSSVHTYWVMQEASTGC